MKKSKKDEEKNVWDLFRTSLYILFVSIEIDANWEVI